MRKRRVREGIRHDRMRIRRVPDVAHRRRSPNERVGKHHEGEGERKRSLRGLTGDNGRPKGGGLELVNRGRMKMGRVRELLKSDRMRSAALTNGSRLADAISQLLG